MPYSASTNNHEQSASWSDLELEAHIVLKVDNQTSGFLARFTPRPDNTHTHTHLQVDLISFAQQKNTIRLAPQGLSLSKYTSDKLLSTKVTT